MPSLNQNFTRLEHDDFVLEFTSVDSILNPSVGSTAYAAWWGLSSTSDATGNLLLSSWSNGTAPNAISSYNIANQFPDCSTSGAFQLIPGNAPFLVEVYETKVVVVLEYATFDDIGTGEYYHELVLMKVDSSNIAHQCQSHVAATGLLTVNGSLFTNKPYR